MNAVYEKLENATHLNGANAAYLEDLYQIYLRDPGAVPPRWRSYFAALEPSAAQLPPTPASVAREPRAASEPPTAPAGAAALEPVAAEKQAAVLRLINAYRVRGHQQAGVDPLRLCERPFIPDLDPAFHGLTEADLDTVFNTGSLAGSERAPLRNVLSHLQQVYCGPVGAEYMHITDTAQKRWVQERLEGARAEPKLSHEGQRQLLQRIVAAEGLERYLHTRYVGQKRFSLEGGESLVPLLDEIIQRGGRCGLQEIVIGMAHRGRLNVLVNTLGKAPRDLFLEFEGGAQPPDRHSGDVKYHQGFSADARTAAGLIHVALAFNPSHLEIIGPAVEGSVRARQQRRDDRDGSQVLALLIHGDAAFAGQGVVMEDFNMSQARGFGTGGTVHVVVNNQIGFTTSNPLDIRSTVYSTDVAKMVQAPIFHVNGDDPEAVLMVAALALDFRMAFRKDVVIDMVCYRRHGHNEADEPAVTQPLMYQKIRSHPTTLQVYGERLVRAGACRPEDVQNLCSSYREALESGASVAPHAVQCAEHAYAVDWQPYFGGRWDDPVQTAVELPRLQRLGSRLVQLPEGFEPHPRVANLLADRRKMAAGALPVDWGCAENLAYASLLEEGYQVRLSGQDSARGTFFHRHAVLHNQSNGALYAPLAHVAERQGRFIIIDSLLSEEAVLAFEYGYATAEPNALIIWEAQFGDFANNAQVVIDQFISSGELKWGRLCGLTLFLPHGYEGQGPEHSSARLERFLQLCAEHNQQVCVPTTPAQMFHMLRRQVLRPYRKPLIVMTPKSLLRHRLSVSSLEDLAQGAFQPVIGECDDIKPAAVRRVVLCSGKVYFDLLQQRREGQLGDVALLRIEQLYPFPQEALAAELYRYARAKEVVWCQEEPRNQGAWYQSKHHFRTCMLKGQRLQYAGRPASASPASGYFNLHVEQQRALVQQALGLSAKEDAELQA